MTGEIAALEAEIKEFKLQLEAVQSGLQADPDSPELQELQTELEQVISLTEASIAELRPSSVPAATAAAAAARSRASAAAGPAQPPPPAPPAKEKWSRENHPAFKKTSAAAAAVPAASASSNADEPDASVSFSVNDTVLAKWHSGDKGFYPARITSITGSSTAPVYIVKFRNYDTTETLRAKDIKPVASSNSSSGSGSNNNSGSSSTGSSANPNKRKADGSQVFNNSNGNSTNTNNNNNSSNSDSMTSQSPITAPIHSSSTTGAVISAAADIDPELAQQTRREPSKVSDGPARPAKIPKKIKANKELEAGKNKWQDFATKGKFGKTARKDSMFRTPEGVNGRVGFTGSGQSMRKDPTRSRHIYQTNGEDEGFA